MRQPRAREWGRSSCVALFVAVLLVAAQPGQGFIPSSERIVGAIAEANKAAGRAQTLRLELTLRIGDGAILAEGELLTHPSGLARLELRGKRNLVERHLLQGTEHNASRNGRPLERPRPFLPPLFFVQADSGTSLRAALSAFGVDTDAVALSPCEESDCFVIGDATRTSLDRNLQQDASEDEARPPGAAPSGRGLELGQSPSREIERDMADEEEEDAGGTAADLFQPPALPATLWVDVYSYRIEKFELANGVWVELGPPKSFAKLVLPEWIVIHEPERKPIRFDFRAASQVSAPARAFSRSWLYAGSTPPAELGDEPAPAAP